MNMHEIVQSVVQIMERNRTQQFVADGGTGRISRSDLGSNFHALTSQNWSQIKFMTKLIPNFAGKENENVIRWIERCCSIARMYRIPDEILMLAAINQLSGRALDWYNRQRMESVASWEDFKFRIREYFERKEP